MLLLKLPNPLRKAHQIKVKEKTKIKLNDQLSKNCRHCLAILVTFENLKRNFLSDIWIKLSIKFIPFITSDPLVGIFIPHSFGFIKVRADQPINAFFVTSLYKRSSIITCEFIKLNETSQNNEWSSSKLLGNHSQSDQAGPRPRSTNYIVLIVPIMH